MDKSLSDTLRQVCVSNGFSARGNCYFRIVGDGVLQIIRPRYQRVFQTYIIQIGLLSLYDQLTPKHFTAGGCVTRYPVTNCAAHNCMPLIFAPSVDKQIELLRDSVIPWLDTITTQKALIRAISQLDPRWNDALKIAPFLACGEINHARKVIREIIGPQAYAQMHGVTTQITQIPIAGYTNTQLYNLLSLLNKGDPAAINSYLQNNRTQNLTYAKFRKRQMPQP